MNNTRFLRNLLGSAAGVCLLAVTSSQGASFLFNEAGDGDISGTPASPTQFGNSPLSVGYSVGSNVIMGSTVAGDYDILSFTVGAGQQLAAINLVSYTSLDDRAFLAVQSGSTWNNGLGAGINFDVTTLLGHAHFGPGAGAAQPGTDALDNLGAGPGAIGFSGPLGAGTYTFLIQQTGPAVISYGLDFQLTAVPEPGEYAAMAGAVLAGFAVWRRTRASKA
jgi:hypothetical protein